MHTRFWSIALCLGLFSAPAIAQEDDAGSGDIGALLDSIPEIATQAPPEEEAAPPEDEDDFADAYPRWVKSCRMALHPNWSPPDKYRKKSPNMLTRVAIKVDTQGNITAVSIVESSKDKKFDKMVLGAVEDTARVPPPPYQYQDAAQKGVMLAFTPRGVK